LVEIEYKIVTDCGFYSVADEDGKIVFTGHEWECTAWIEAAKKTNFRKRIKVIYPNNN
jgi:hypothetical protein